MNISARRVLTFKPSQILKEDITSIDTLIVLDEKGNEDTSIAPKDGKPKALSSFIQEE
jgi:integration host factor subunit alpha